MAKILRTLQVYRNISLRVQTFFTKKFETLFYRWNKTSVLPSPFFDQFSIQNIKEKLLYIIYKSILLDGHRQEIVVSSFVALTRQLNIPSAINCSLHSINFYLHL